MSLDNVLCVDYRIRQHFDWHKPERKHCELIDKMHVLCQTQSEYKVQAYLMNISKELNNAGT